MFDHCILDRICMSAMRDFFSRRNHMQRIIDSLRIQLKLLFHIDHQFPQLAIPIVRFIRLSAPAFPIYIANVIKNMAKHCQCFPRMLLHQHHLFSVTTSDVHTLLFAVVSDRVNPWRNTASENRDRMRIERGEFTGCIYLTAYARSLFNTTDTQFSSAAQSANAIHQNLPNDKICTMHYYYYRVSISLLEF